MSKYIVVGIAGMLGAAGSAFAVPSFVVLPSDARNSLYIEAQANWPSNNPNPPSFDQSDEFFGTPYANGVQQTLFGGTGGFVTAGSEIDLSTSSSLLTVTGETTLAGSKGTADPSAFLFATASSLTEVRFFLTEATAVQIDLHTHGLETTLQLFSHTSGGDIAIAELSDDASFSQILNLQPGEYRWNAEAYAAIEIGASDPIVFDDTRSFSVSLQIIPAPGAIGLGSFAALFAAARRRR